MHVPTRPLVVLVLACAAVVLLWWLFAYDSSRPDARRANEGESADNWGAVLRGHGKRKALDARGASDPEVPARTVSLRARVVDAFTGAPIRGARVRVLADEGSQEATVDEAGQTTFDLDAAEGLVHVEASAPAYIDRGRLVSRAEETFDLALMHRARAGAQRLMTGRVVNEAGAAVGGARIQAHSPDGVLRTTSNFSGGFSLSLPAGWSWALVDASHPDHGEGSVLLSARHAAPQHDEWDMQSRLAVEIRLGRPAGVPVRIFVNGKPGEQTFRMTSVPADARVTGAAQSQSVRDGQTVQIEHGMQVLTLVAQEGHPLAEPLCVEWNGSRLARMERPGDAPPDTETWSERGQIDEIRFDVVTSGLRVRVVADGVPRSCVDVAVEDASVAKPYLSEYKEFGTTFGGGARLASLAPGYRDSVFRRRMARTDDDGYAQFSGWLPHRALVHVRSDDVPDTFLEVTLDASGSNEIRVEVEPGCLLDATLPTWLDHVVLRETSTDVLLYIARTDLPRTVPAGRYFVRRREHDGRGGLVERALFGPFDAPAGGTLDLDLAAVAPAHELRIRFRAPHAASPVMLRSVGRLLPSAQALDGSDVHVVRVPSDFAAAQLELGWIGSAGEVHRHRVDVRPGSPGSATSLDLDHARSSLFLEVENASSVDQTLTLHCAEPEASAARYHEVSTFVGGGTTTHMEMHDLPAGQYMVRCGDAETRAEPSTLEIRDARVRIVLMRATLQIDLVGDPDASDPVELAGALVQLLGPLGEASTEGGSVRQRWNSQRAGAGASVVFRALRPGIYKLRVGLTGSTPGQATFVDMGILRVEGGDARHEAVVRAP